MKATDKLVQFVLETKEKDLPPEMYNIVKRACLDSIGTTLAGSAQPVGHIMTEYVKESGGVPEATVKRLCVVGPRNFFEGVSRY